MPTDRIQLRVCQINPTKKLHSNLVDIGEAVWRQFSCSSAPSIGPFNPSITTSPLFTACGSSAASSGEIFNWLYSCSFSFALYEWAKRAEYSLGLSQRVHDFEEREFIFWSGGCLQKLQIAHFLRTVSKSGNFCGKYFWPKCETIHFNTYQNFLKSLQSAETSVKL